MKPDAYTTEELIDLLKARKGGATLQNYAAEIGISFQMLSQIMNGQRSIGNEKVLAYLAGNGKKFIHQDQWILIDG